MSTGVPLILVVGVGNEFRRDDGAGLYAARELRRRLPGCVRIIEESGEGASLMDAWHGAHTVVILDAVRSGHQAGTLFRLDASKEQIPKKFFHYSSHTFGVAEAIEMARELRQLPQTLLVYGIEGSDFGTGQGLSPAVSAAMSHLLNSVEAEISRFS